MSYWSKFLDWWTPVKVGLALTALVLIGFIFMALQRNCILLDTSVLECRSNWARFWASKPNEIGDTLAGFAGSLAFIWIVVTVWLQSVELRAQHVEFEKMSSSLDQQAGFLKKEFEGRVYQNGHNTLNDLFRMVALRIEASSPKLKWRVARPTADVRDDQFQEVQTFGGSLDSSSINAIELYLSRQLPIAQNALHHLAYGAGLIENSRLSEKKIEVIRGVRDLILAAIAASDELEPGHRVRVLYTQLQPLSDCLKSILNAVERQIVETELLSESQREGGDR